MRASGKILLFAFLVTGCAKVPRTSLVECEHDSSFARGARDVSHGRKANLGFSRGCTQGTRDAAIAAYREGFSSTSPKGKKAVVEPDEELDEETVEVDEASLHLPILAAPGREPSALSWVCEVEANSRVFTGVGGSRDEAMHEASATCGSHFQASYCTKADCKQNL